MHKRTMTYKDFDGHERTDTFYFNLTEAELFELELGAIVGGEGGFSADLQRIADAQNGQEIIDTFKKIVLGAYGERSADGKYFRKQDASGYSLSGDFASTQAFSDLFILLSTNADEASKFINAIAPAESINKIVDSSVAAQDGEEKTISQLAREQSEARLQGHKDKSSVEIGKTAPAEVETDEERNAREFAEFQAQKRAQEQQ